MVHPSSPPNPGRRKFLSYATSFLGLIGTAFVAVPFLSAFKPSARAEAAGAPVQVDISTINTGEMMIVEWRGKPVFVVKISDDSIKLLSQVDAKLADPSLETPFQPEYAKNEFRSRKEGIAVITGVCSHLGCAPKYYPEPGSTDFDPDWQGGFFCPCHGSKFDLLGRVYAGVPAPTNMEVPPHYFAKDNILIIGSDGVA
jgi:ubiquinol-cytochrome c reductase iron-sulfur subunit